MRGYAPKGEETFDAAQTTEESQPGADRREAACRSLATDGQLMAFDHSGVWQPMDTLRDKLYLESLRESGKAPWKAWT